jgi:eukaryotic-like serine/threonine-protein kinase
VIAEEWARLKSLYGALQDCDAEERITFLNRLEAEDPAICAALRALLAQHEKTDDFLERPVARIQALSTQPAAIGRYRILRLLGEGGMGAVYEAEQEQPCRTVALKVIKPGLSGPEMLWRFERESESLGRLQHPGIAQIYEAGTAETECGRRPYFAMELVRGDSLLEYAVANGLNTNQRLELMAKVCEAVHHAHQRGIIHRDLKPTNILIDATGQPKILDFGVARATNGDTDAARETNKGELVGTLAYMSPEQVLADPLEIDTRSDVYALGVILFEVLAGRLPYNMRCPLAEAARTIQEEDPTKLSSISRTYRGDIETIAAKALEKDKARRYSSAESMAADIRRYLRDEPIAARGPSATYQLQKLVRRHKAVALGMASVFLVLIAGVIVSTWEATRARRAEQMASAVNDFLRNDLLAQASVSRQARPGIIPDRNLKVRTVLDRAAVEIQGKFSTQPLVEASIRQTIGNTYGDLGLYADAQRQLRRALELRRLVLGELDPETLASIHDVAFLYWEQGNYVEAERSFSNALNGRRRVLGEKHPDTLNSMHYLAIVYDSEERYSQAEKLYTAVFEARGHILGENHPDTLMVLSDLAGLYSHRGDYMKAESLYIKALGAQRSLLGGEHPDTLLTIDGLADLYDSQSNYAQSEKLYVQVFSARQRLQGEEHPYTLATMHRLALVYAEQGKYSQAEPLYRTLLVTRQRLYGEEHPDTLLTISHLARLYRDQGKYSQAEALYTKLLTVEQRLLGESDPNTVRTAYSLAKLYLLKRDYESAEPLYVKALRSGQGVTLANDSVWSSAINDLALLYINQRKYQQSEVLLRQGLDNVQETKDDSWLRYSCESSLGASLAGQKKYAQAEPLLLSGYTGLVRLSATIPLSSRDILKEGGAWLISLYKAWGKPKNAAAWSEKLKGRRTGGGI